MNNKKKKRTNDGRAIKSDKDRQQKWPRRHTHTTNFHAKSNPFQTQCVELNYLVAMLLPLRFCPFCWIHLKFVRFRMFRRWLFIYLLFLNEHQRVRAEWSEQVYVCVCDWAIRYDLCTKLLVFVPLDYCIISFKAFHFFVVPSLGIAKK